MSMYKKDGDKGYESYKPEMPKGLKPHPKNEGPRSGMDLGKDVHSKMEPRMEKSFQRVEHQPLYTRHPGKPSGCME